MTDHVARLIAAGALAAALAGVPTANSTPNLARRVAALEDSIAHDRACYATINAYRLVDGRLSAVRETRDRRIRWITSVDPSCVGLDNGQPAARTAAEHRVPKPPASAPASQQPAKTLAKVEARLRLLEAFARCHAISVGVVDEFRDDDAHLYLRYAEPGEKPTSFLAQDRC